MARRQIKSIPAHVNYTVGRPDAWDEFRARRIAGETWRQLGRDFGDVEPTTARNWWIQYLESREGLEDKEAQEAGRG